MKPISSASENYAGHQGDAEHTQSSDDLPAQLSCALKDLKITGAYLENRRINDIRFINQHFIKVNKNLEKGDHLVVHAQFLKHWREQRNARRIPVIGGIVKAWDFALLRIMPKVAGIKKLYFGITKGKNRILSKAEVLGRLISCGFEIVQVLDQKKDAYVICKKVKAPSTSKPSYGPLFKMTRVGKNGKIIGVYKLRTMHPYSEFLQEYLINNHGYNQNGKIKDDFRTTLWARRLRKYWIDEIPQLLNVLKGDMKLVGVRPVSPVYFKDIPKELQELRKKYKPGCIPPYVAFNEESSLESVLDSELKYLKMKEKNPWFTDTKLFFKALYNIIFKGKRSA
ncbi:MAG: sugar transferase [Bacteroidota bacterium]